VGGYFLEWFLCSLYGVTPSNRIVAPRPIVHPGDHERFDERLGYAIRLRRSHGFRARHKADRLGGGDGLMVAVTAAVAGEPVDGMCGFLLAKPSLDVFEHEIADHLAGVIVMGCPSHRHRSVCLLDL